MLNRIGLSEPHMTGREMTYIGEAIDSNWVAPAGPQLDTFEKKLSDYTGVKYATALSSGTAALHLALLTLGVRKDDLVLCQSLTFVASVNPVKYIGAIPVLIGSEAESWNLCPNVLEDAIKHYSKKGKKPKAIIAVHLYGMPVLLDPILEICRKYEIPLIEDAAEALGSTFRAKQLGSFGVIGILSFNGNKIITTSGGGAVLTDNQAHARQCLFLSTQAKDDAPHYEHSQIGYNYRLSNVCAAIGLAQIEVIDDRVQQRRSIFNLYHEQLSSLPGISFQEEPTGCFSNRWMTAIQIDPMSSDHLDSQKLRTILLNQNIETRPVWKPIHLQPCFSKAPYFGDSTSEKLFRAGLCLPSSSFLPTEAILRVCDAIKNAFHTHGAKGK
jgi:dTDP-4-amino-4,6-dideoxygalactose transaminase